MSGMMARNSTVTTIRQASAADIGLLLLISLIWASAFVAIKVAVPAVGPLWLAAIRVAIGCLAVLPFALHAGIELPKTATVWLLVISMSLLNVVIPFFLIAWAELTIDAGVASLLMGVGPILALLSGHFFTLDDRINRWKLMAVLLGFCGVVILVGGDALSQLGGRHTLAQFAALAGALCYVSAGTLIRKIPIGSVRLAFLALVLGSAVLLPVALFFDSVPAMPGPQAASALLYLGIVPTGIAYVMRFHLINTVGYSTFSLSVNLIPVFGVLLGAIVLAERPSPQTGLALALVIGGLFVARLGGKKA
ncbi:MAG: DMT family transporter [Pseudomonadota bacterium]